MGRVETNQNIRPAGSKRKKRSWKGRDQTPRGTKVRNAHFERILTEVLPYDVDRNKAKLILDTILKTIADGVIRDGRYDARFLGVFYVKTIPAKLHQIPRKKGIYDKVDYIEYLEYPERKTIAFRATEAIRKPYGNQGTDERA